MGADDRLDRTRAAFTRQAETFDAHAVRADLKVEDRFRDALGPAGAGRVLDVACGPGVVTAAVARDAEAVVGLDATDAMLTKARARAANAGLQNVTFEVGDAENLPFEDASFDGVVTRLSLHHFQDPARAIGEMRRVLRPGGRLVVVDVVADPDPDKAALHNAIEILRDPSHVRMMPPAEIEALIAAAGFAIADKQTWDKTRGFDEWMAIVNDPVIIAPLRHIAMTLAASGHDAGIGLKPNGEDLTFFHRWLLIAADR